MEDNMLDWAEIVCLNTSVNGPQQSITENKYMIALDISDYDQSFDCPCCREKLSVKIIKREPLSGEHKRRVIREKRKESWERLMLFWGVSAFLIAAIAARLFARGALATALTGAVALLFSLVWLPGLILLIWEARLIRDNEKIISGYEKKLPANEITLEGVSPGSSHEHYFEYIPEFLEYDTEADYGME